jgi:tRNA nucleotidyltransferase (CCA-adding enzyme)
MDEKIWEVGGSLRNRALGKTAADLDYAAEYTRAEFEAKYPTAKYTGKDFPVYLLALLNGPKPDEFALTRTEKSTGPKDTDFVTTGEGVSIVDDLIRRDFPINSIARNIATGEILDPLNGYKDIEDRILRANTDVSFIESSVRIYRLARFAAELEEFNFTIEPRTIQLAKESNHLLQFVVPDRVYAELKKVYARSATPSRFFRVLQEVDALRTHFKPLHIAQFVPAGPAQYHGDHTVLDHSLEAFDRAKQKGHSFAVALASLFHDTGKVVTKKSLLPSHVQHELRSYWINKKFVKQHRFTASEEELIVAAARNHMDFHAILKIKKHVKLIRFYLRIKRRAEEFIQVADNDHPLCAEQLVVLANLKRTIKETVIDIPKEILHKGNDAVTSFVEQRYTETYKKILKGE